MFHSWLAVDPDPPSAPQPQLFGSPDPTTTYPFGSFSSAGEPHLASPTTQIDSLLHNRAFESNPNPRRSRISQQCPPFPAVFPPLRSHFLANWWRQSVGHHHRCRPLNLLCQLQLAAASALPPSAFYNDKPQQSICPCSRPCPSMLFAICAHNWLRGPSLCPPNPTQPINSTRIELTWPDWLNCLNISL